ncbi:MAG TPA: zinc-ribbon domain-containing protein [Kofleriaceae bacterium]|nr:zinc-ribbon domain-containing protein [Kofleriaceae bacterium]
MDVRCEKCNTEYELDEARLKPGGVTVKCTTCGHMFKIRKRSPTQSSGVPQQPPARAGTGSGPVSGPHSGPIGTGEGDRNWIIRLDNGEQRQCRELGILQQWIITGLVSQESMISRSGKTWKRLGDIPELASFFVVAKEARDARAQRESGAVTPPRGTGPAPSPTAGGVAKSAVFERETVVEPLRIPGTGRHVAPPAPAPPPPRAPTGGPPAPPPRATSVGAAVGAAVSPPARPGATPPPPPPRATPPTGNPQTPLPPPGPSPASTLLGMAGGAGAPLPAPPPPAAPPPPPRPPTAPPPLPPPMMKLADEPRSTGAWATNEVKPIPEVPDDVDTVGPRRGAVRPSAGDAFGGVVRPVPTDDVAFAGGLAARRPLDDDNFDAFADEEPRRRGAGLWIALGSLVVIGAAVGVVYFTVLRPSPARSAAPPAGDAGDLVALADAGGVGPAIDAAPTVSPSEDLLDQARVQLGRDSGAALSAAEKMLAEGGKADAMTLGLRARLVSAQAQVIEDEAELATDAKTAEKVRRESKQLVLTALGLAQRAIKAGASDPLANIAMADVLRLQGKPMKDLRRYLDTARQASPGDKEASLVEALAAIRDKDYPRAEQLLKGLDSGALEGTGDVRPRWHLARVAFLQKKQADARTAADAVIAAAPEHAGARAMLARLGTVAVDPLPTEDIDAGAGAGGGGGSGSSSGSSGTGTGTGSSGGGGGGGEPTGNDYDKLLAKANKLAEVDCGQAMPYYQRALEVQPNGVEALSGMGFCHIDAKQFASAHSKFRAALGISPRFERALWGVAEAYQQQGRTDLAITAYEKYLETYPNSAAAQRQLDRLKGTGGGGPTPPDNGGGGSGSVEKPPDPPPDPKPETTPAPETTPGPASNP